LRLLGVYFTTGSSRPVVGSVGSGHVPAANMGGVWGRFGAVKLPGSGHVGPVTWGHLHPGSTWGSGSVWGCQAARVRSRGSGHVGPPCWCAISPSLGRPAIVSMCSARRAAVWGGCACLRTFPYKNPVSENFSGRFAARGRRRAQIGSPDLWGRSQSRSPLALDPFRVHAGLLRSLVAGHQRSGRGFPRATAPGTRADATVPRRNGPA
jgi:hypothetical protein